ncbi:MAG: hypothetical protein JW982_04715 [Spirochaetes bacterium]|nr:hypothetical protein [Spirochaetota bacterium]
MNRTSLNVSGYVFDEMKEVCLKFNISRKDIIKRIFTLCHNNFDFVKGEYGKLTAYQKKAPGDSWKCMRVDFDELQCDLYFLYRNRFRISLSKLLAVGFVLFFDQIVNELSEKSDNSDQIKKDILDTYTVIKQLLYFLVKDSFIYFNIKEAGIP